ncbi:MAG: ABC-F family ATP-binding cassette domain-containing protein [Gemmataceae bacterium]|nr:ABC-F family ATP-binding cassette domain-containing protein [Gemmataceae bacterium]
MSVLLGVQGLTKAFGQRPLFKDLSFDLAVGERIGLIGPNGAGKSTLLKPLAGREPVDSGIRTARKGARIGYLAQDDLFEPGKTLREVIVDALAGENLEDYERETRAAIHLTRVGFNDHDLVAEKLSGGWRKRLSLARELAFEPDLLLLDEPTNHLDLPGILWLERLLRSSNFGYLVATHDRAFLRAVADEILEINKVYPAGYFRSKGSYEDFASRREEFLTGQASQQEAVANQVRRETEWLGRKAAAQTRKAASRVEDAHKRREELAELKYRNSQAGPAGISFAATGRQTRKLLTVTGLAKQMGGRELFRDIDLILTPGMKLGLLGPNGSGKSVLLRTLSGEHKPDAGTVVSAENLRTVMFEQGRTALDPLQNLKKALCPNGDTVKFQDKSYHVLAWAKRFLFKDEQLDMAVGALSGGEQARLRMAQMMVQPADLLLLDEPTNDLDIPALEVLEETLASFPGALVLVSHDRELMDRICTEVVGLDGEGGSGNYGSVDQWLTAYEQALEQKEKAQAKAAAKSSAAPVKAGSKARKRLSNREQEELDGMEAKLLAAEELLAKLHEEVERSANAGHLILAEACRLMDEQQTVVEKLYQRWQELEERRNSG